MKRNEKITRIAGVFYNAVYVSLFVRIVSVLTLIAQKEITLTVHINHAVTDATGFAEEKLAQKSNQSRRNDTKFLVFGCC